eukprot:2200818-Rhodomonas_salina.1
MARVLRRAFVPGLPLLAFDLAVHQGAGRSHGACSLSRKKKQFFFLPQQQSEKRSGESERAVVQFEAALAVEGVRSAMPLCVSYAMSGTGIVYGAMALRDV